MHIWLIQTGEPLPFDHSVKKMRTALLADKLIARGHSVVWWTSAFDHFTKKWIFEKDTETEIKPDFKIIALKGKGYKKNFSPSRFLDHRLLAWKFFRRAGNMKKPDFIAASLPPHDIVFQVVKYAKQNDIPCIIDIRDPWPDIFLEHIPSPVRTLAKIILLNDFSMVRKIMQRADGLIAASDSLLQWGLNYANRKMTNKDKVFPLGYRKQAPVEPSLIQPQFFELEKKLKNKFVVLFVGTISKSYHNPDILLKVAQLLNEERDIHFLIAGNGELLEELKHSAQNLSNISFLGWLNQHEIEFWLKNSKAGICPATHEVNLPTNKAYTYLSGGLPIISAFHGELKLLIETEQIGIYYPPNDVDRLTDAILKLYSDEKFYKTLSANSKKIFDAKFDANKIYEDYAMHITDIARLHQIK
jgi:glycosyltransferase involved in cell wall biosynthesis